MLNENTIVVDPVGRPVVLPSDLSFDEGLPPVQGAILDAVRTVIEAPACLIAVSVNQLYYFRSLGWNYTLLVEVGCREETWRVLRCQKNPSSALVLELLARGTFIAGQCLD